MTTDLLNSLSPNFYLSSRLPERPYYNLDHRILLLPIWATLRNRRQRRRRRRRSKFFFFFCRACAFTFVPSASCQLLILVAIQLFHSLSSCPYRKDGLYSDTNLQQSEDLVYLVNQFATVCTEAAVLVLSSLKTYHDTFFECFVTSVSSRPYQIKANNFPTYDFYDRQVSCTSPTLSIQALSIPQQHRSDIGMSTGSNWHYGTERILLVRLSQQFVSKSKSKSRCSPLPITSMI